MPEIHQEPAVKRFPKATVVALLILLAELLLTRLTGWRVEY